MYVHIMHVYTYLQTSEHSQKCILEATCYVLTIFYSIIKGWHYSHFNNFSVHINLLKTIMYLLIYIELCINMLQVLFRMNMKAQIYMYHVDVECCTIIVASCHIKKVYNSKAIRCVIQWTWHDRNLHSIITNITVENEIHTIIMHTECNTICI